MQGKTIVGIAVVVIMGSVIYGIVSVINGTLDDLDSKCKTCGEDCKIKSCTNDSSSAGRMISYGLMGIYLLSAAGILYFSFQNEADEDEDEEETKAPENPPQQQGNEFEYG